MSPTAVPLTAAWVTLGLRAHPLRNILRQNRTVATIHDSIRQRVSLPARIAKRVLVLAETRKTSESRVLVDLIETGLRAKEAQHQRFFVQREPSPYGLSPRDGCLIADGSAESLWGPTGTREAGGVNSDVRTRQS